MDSEQRVETESGPPDDGEQHQCVMQEHMLLNSGLPVSSAQHLPPEILSAIFEHIPIGEHFDLWTSERYRHPSALLEFWNRRCILSAASLVCRSWRGPAQAEMGRVLCLFGQVPSALSGPGHNDGTVSRHYDGSKASPSIVRFLVPSDHPTELRLMQERLTSVFEPQTLFLTLTDKVNASAAVDVGPYQSRLRNCNLAGFNHLKELQVRVDTNERVLAHMLSSVHMLNLDRLDIRILYPENSRRESVDWGVYDQPKCRPTRLALHSTPTQLFITNILQPLAQNVTDLTINLAPGGHWSEEYSDDVKHTSLSLFQALAPQLVRLRITDVEHIAPNYSQRPNSTVSLAVELKRCNAGHLKFLALPIDRTQASEDPAHRAWLEAIPKSVTVLELALHWPYEFVQSCYDDGVLSHLRKIIFMRRSTARLSSDSADIVSDVTLPPDSIICPAVGYDSSTDSPPLEKRPEIVRRWINGSWPVSYGQLD